MACSRLRRGNSRVICGVVTGGAAPERWLSLDRGTRRSDLTVTWTLIYRGARRPGVTPHKFAGSAVPFTTYRWVTNSRRLTYFPS